MDDLNKITNSLNNYKCNVEIPLGKGSFGTVIKCESTNNNIALKLSTNVNHEDIDNEIEIYKHIGKGAYKYM